MPLLKEDAERTEELLLRLADFNDEVLLEARTRLLEIGSGGLGGSTAGYASGGNELWPTLAAAQRSHEQQRRAIQAARGALWRLVRKARLSTASRPLPSETWGDPARELHTELTRGRWQKGEPKDRSLAEADRAACAALRCPHCEREALKYASYVRMEEGWEEYRAFGGCGVCALILELPTDWWRGLVGYKEAAAPAGEAEGRWVAPDEPAVVRRTPAGGNGEGRGTRVVLAPGGGGVGSRPGAARGPREETYFDHETEEWYRSRRHGVALLVTGKEDMSAQQEEKARECWACGSDAPHSRAFHEAVLVKQWRRHTGVRHDDNGWVRCTALEEPLPDPAEAWGDD